MGVSRDSIDAVFGVEGHHHVSRFSDGHYYFRGAVNKIGAWWIDHQLRFVFVGSSAVIPISIFYFFSPSLHHSFSYFSSSNKLSNRISSPLQAAILSNNPPLYRRILLAQLSDLPNAVSRSWQVLDIAYHFLFRLVLSPCGAVALPQARCIL